MKKDSLIGKQLGEYKLESALGEGGMATVYRALDVGLNRYVAVKVILASFREESDYIERFQREAQAIAQLEHPNIVTIYRYGDDDSLLFMAMQYVDGADLADVIASFHDDGEFIDFDDIIRLAHEIGTALDYAHSKGVIHRDIKPHNILINKENRAIVTDFGLALMTEVGTRGEIFGSPHYIAPEQAISSAGVVPQSDQYALGVMLYEMLTGDVPFDAEEALDIAMKHMTEDIPAPRAKRPELNPATEAVLLKALAKEPTERYSSCKALAEALESALRSTPEKPKAPRKTIHQRVTLKNRANPLPPIPAVVQQPTAEHQAEPTAPASRQAPTLPPPISQTPTQANTTTAPQRTHRTPLLIAAAVILLVTVGVIAFMMLSSAGISDATATLAPPTENAEIAVIAPTETQETIISTEPIIPTATITPAPIIAPTDTPVAQTVTLSIVWVGEDSLFVINTGDTNLPLAGLELSGTGSVSGSEWGIATLAPEQCVALVKDSGNPVTPVTNCTEVGTRLTRTGAERFWVASFAVSYNNSRVTVCETAPCTVTFAP